MEDGMFCGVWTSNTDAAVDSFLSHISTLSLFCWRAALAATDCQNMSSEFPDLLVVTANDCLSH